jgi:hypothetical protein
MIAMTAIPSNYAIAADQLKSPYFVDGVHCEGLDDQELDAKIKEFYADDAIAKLGVKAQNQAKCEKLFSKFGIDKFQWVTPDDLEKLNFGLKNSGKFKSLEVQIEKSELQNHVHLKGNFAQFEPQTYYSFNFKGGIEKGGVTGNRRTTKADGLVQFHKRGPENPGIFDLGFTSLRSSAKAPLSSAELRRKNEDVAMNDAEKKAQAKQNWQFDEIFYRVPLNNGALSIPLNMRVGVNSSKLSLDEVSDSNFNMELGTEFQPDMFMPTKIGLSLLYSTFSSLGQETLLRESEGKGVNRQIVFVGASEDFSTRGLSGHLKFYRSLTSDLHYFGDVDLRFKFSEFAGIKSSIGFAQDLVYGAILPEHRFGLPNREQVQIYYLGESDFQAFEADHKITLKAGYGDLYAEGNSPKNRYSRFQSFAEVGLKTRADNIDVGLSFIYGNQRLY